MEKESILNVTVSCFRNVKEVNNPKYVNLLKWLYSDKYSNKIEAIRLEEDTKKRKQLKLELPVMMPSGIFTGRNSEGWKQASGLMQFDIDFKDNRHISNYDSLKEELSKIDNIAYIGLSASGNGFWGLVPITNPNQYRQHSLAFSEDLKQYGIICDDAVQNPAQPRYYSFDDNPFINHFAKPYERLHEPLQTDKKTVLYTKETATQTDKERFIRNITETIIRLQVDITTNYQAWYQIAQALANEFGEGGRNYFHVLSQFHAAYSSAKTDKQFNACLKATTRTHYTLGTL